MTKQANYYGFAHQFLNLVYASIEEMEKYGNITLSLIEDTGDEERNNEIHDERMKWSDAKMALPILFNLYHGLELFMKAILNEHEGFSKGHKLTLLLKKIKAIEDPSLGGIISILDKQVNNSPFEDYFMGNKVTIDNFYEVLKYAEYGKDMEVSIATIFGKEEEGLKRFVEVKNDIQKLRERLYEWKKSKIKNRDEDK